eukprot:gene22285-27248_t
MASFDEEFYDCAEGPSEVTGQERPAQSTLVEEVANLDISSGPSKVSPTLPGKEDDIKEVGGKADEGGSVVDYEAPPTIEKSLEKALAYKEEGNTHFRNQDFESASQAYSYAVDYCPTDDVNKEHLATFYGNRAAAYFSMEEYALTVDDCTKALEHKPDYVKVIARRMQANEKLDKVEDALADSKKILEIDPSFPKIAQNTARLQKQYDEKMEKLKNEALGKLKELGNTILGNFGMSLDNFKMVQDPKTGGWSINMNTGK